MTEVDDAMLPRFLLSSSWTDRHYPLWHTRTTFDLPLDLTSPPLPTGPILFWAIDTLHVILCARYPHLMQVLLES